MFIYTDCSPAHVSDNLDTKSTHIICTLGHGKIEDTDKIVVNDLKALLRSNNQFSTLPSRSELHIRAPVRDFVYPDPIQHFPAVSPAKKIMLKLLDQCYLPAELPPKRIAKRGASQPIADEYQVITPNILAIKPVTRLTDQLEGRVFNIHDQKTSDMLTDLLIKRHTDPKTGKVMTFVVHGDLGLQGAQTHLDTCTCSVHT